MGGGHGGSVLTKQAAPAARDQARCYAHARTRYLHGWLLQHSTSARPRLRLHNHWSRAEISRLFHWLPLLRGRGKSIDSVYGLIAAESCSASLDLSSLGRPDPIGASGENPRKEPARPAPAAFERKS